MIDYSKLKYKSIAGYKELIPFMIFRFIIFSELEAILHIDEKKMSHYHDMKQY